MCRFIPTEDVSTLPQPGHRHLYTPLNELWGREGTPRRWSGTDVRSDKNKTRRWKDALVYFWLFGTELVCLLQLHVQAFVGAAVHLGDRRRRSGAHVAVVPAPVAAAAAVRELAAAALHVGRRRGASCRVKKTKNTRWVCCKRWISIFCLQWIDFLKPILVFKVKSVDWEKLSSADLSELLLLPKLGWVYFLTLSTVLLILNEEFFWLYFQQSLLQC